MLRAMTLAIILSGFVMLSSGCTHTVRGLGKDLHIGPMQDYNSTTTATEMDH